MNPQFSTGDRIASAATRFKPRSAVEFNPPIVGPSGASLLSYQWAWTMGEKEHATEGLVPKRISDWDESMTSGATGRELVHQYSVRNKDGTQSTVSAESVPALLGFNRAMSPGPGSETGSNFKSVSSALKKYGQLQVELAPINARIEENDRIHAEVKSTLTAPAPVIGHELPGFYRRENAQWVQVGDAEPATLWVAETNPGRKEDVLARAAENWYEKRAVERGAETQLRMGLMRMSANDLRSRITKAEARLEKITGSRLNLCDKTENTPPLDLVGGIAPMPLPLRFEGLDDIAAHIATPGASNARNQADHDSPNL